MQSVYIKKSRARNGHIAKRFFEFCFMLFIILSTDTLMFKTNAIALFHQVPQILICMGCVFLVVLCLIKKKEVDAQFFGLVLVIASALFSMLLAGDITGGYFFKITLLLFGYFLFVLMPFERFSAMFVSCMRIISIVALMGWIFADVLRGITQLPIIRNANNLEFKTLFLTNIPLFTYHTGALRNWGPFWEPGVFQAYLIVALIFVLFCGRNKHIVFDITLFSVSIFSTFSTTGVIALTLIFIAYLFFSDPHDKIVGMLKMLIVFLGAGGIAIMLSSPALYNMVFAKLAQDMGESLGSRVLSIITAGYIFVSHPIIGVGPNFIDAYSSDFLMSIQSELKHITQTNAILFHFNAFGLGMGLYYLYKLTAFIKNRVRAPISFIIALSSVVLLLFSEPLIYSLFFSCIIFYAGNAVIAPPVYVNCKYIMNRV